MRNALSAALNDEARQRRTTERRTRARLVRAFVMFRSFFFDPIRLVQKYRGLPHFVRNAWSYHARARGGAFRFDPAEIMYTSFERYLDAGAAQGHYFHQDLWAARLIARSDAVELVDVGSRIDGFVAHVLPFKPVRYVDIRPINGTVEGLEFVPGSVLSLPFADDSVPLLSCLHVIEHIGLGRYGDPIDPDGHRSAARELSRVLAPGGRLLVGTPVGRQRLVFDAHRVFDPATVIDMFGGLTLTEFSLVDDHGTTVRRNVAIEAARACEYGCGLFVFEKARVS